MYDFLFSLMIFIYLLFLLLLHINYSSFRIYFIYIWKQNRKKEFNNYVFLELTRYDVLFICKSDEKETNY